MLSGMGARLDHFAGLYRADPDPWDYAGSSAEAYKRGVVRAALGTMPLASGLELGCGPGISTVSLAPRFASLLAVDGTEEAVRLARARTRLLRGVSVRHVALPCPLPPRRFDAVIATEVLYYLPPQALDATLQAVRGSLRPGGRLVATHSTASFSDTQTPPRLLDAMLCRRLGAPVRTIVGAGWRCMVYGPC